MNLVPSTPELTGGGSSPSGSSALPSSSSSTTAVSSPGSGLKVPASSMASSSLAESPHNYGCSQTVGDGLLVNGATAPQLETLLDSPPEILIREDPLELNLDPSLRSKILALCPVKCKHFSLTRDTWSRLMSDPKRKANAVHNVSVLQAGEDLWSALGSYIATDDQEQEEKYLNMLILLVMLMVSNAERELKNLALESHDLAPIQAPSSLERRGDATLEELLASQRSKFSEQDRLCKLISTAARPGGGGGGRKRKRRRSHKGNSHERDGEAQSPKKAKSEESSHSPGHEGGDRAQGKKRTASKKS